MHCNGLVIGLTGYRCLAGECAVGECAVVECEGVCCGGVGRRECVLLLECR